MGAGSHALFTLSGTPAVEQYGVSVLEEMRHVDQQLARAAAWMTKQIVARASADTHWKELAHAISVVPSPEGGFVVQVAGAEESARARALEYGDMDTPPQPLLRSALGMLLTGASGTLNKGLDLSGGVS